MIGDEVEETLIGKVRGAEVGKRWFGRRIKELLVYEGRACSGSKRWGSRESD